MADTQVGSAYVTVKAVLDKNSTADIEDALSESGSEGGDMLSAGLLSKVKGLAGPILAAIGVAEIGQKLYEIGQQAFDAYASYEQLAGGVKKLFGEEVAQTVMQNANKAYQTAGMSANDYMETITSFSASLIKSLDGDTETAANMADMAIAQMSDNANMFGTNMESIQTAYTHFARGQFDLLDNLNLGYDGTKEGMEELLRHAEEIEGFEFGSLSIDNFADIIEAIEAIQTEMEITGTTANEAAGTIEGSSASMKAAWANWLTELGKSDADMAAVSQQLADTAITFAQNALKLIGTIIVNFVTSIPSLLSGIGNALATAFKLDEFIALFTAGWNDMIAANSAYLQQLGADISAKFGAAKDAAIAKWNELKAGVTNAISALSATLSNVVGAIRSFVTSTFESLKTTIMNIWDSIRDAVSTAVSTVRDTVVNVLSGIGSTISGIFSGVRDAIVGPFERARDALSGIVDGIRGMFNFSFSWPSIPLPHFSISPAGWSVGDLLHGSIPSLGISWYGEGGIVDGATLIGAGERGAELVWPAYEPYLTKYAEAIAKRMPHGNGGTHVYINGARVNDDADVERLFGQFMLAANRKWAM